MQPRTVSASSLATWEECPAKYRAHYIDRVPEVGKKVAADKGSVVHYCLEHFVDEVYLKRITKWEDKDRFLELLREGFKKIMLRPPGASDADWPDCLEMAERWYGRTDLSGREVLSVENKIQYDVPASSGPIKLTFIMDRLDLVHLPNGNVEFHVVDYKSQQMAESFADLENKLQAQIYALAVYLWYGYPGGPYEGRIDSVWVHLDLLRHSEIGVEFTREQCLDTYGWLLEQVDIIRSMPDNDAPEVLGPHCNFCSRRGNCGSLRKSIANGSFIGQMDLGQLLEVRQQLKGQVSGVTAMLKEIESVMNRVMKETQTTRVQSGEWLAEWDTGKGTRIIDPSRAATILGPELMSHIAKINITDIDKLLAGDSLDDTQKAAIRSLITMRYDNPGVKVKKAPKVRKPKGQP